MGRRCRQGGSPVNDLLTGRGFWVTKAVKRRLWRFPLFPERKTRTGPRRPWRQRSYRRGLFVLHSGGCAPV